MTSAGPADAAARIPAGPDAWAGNRLRLRLRLQPEGTFALAVLATGVAAGLAGALLTLLLHAVQHVAFGYSENAFLQGVERASDLRRVVAVGTGGLVVGLGWWIHRGYLRRQVPRPDISVARALADHEPRLPFLATTTDALLQIVAVATGGSIGREGAPRQVGGALGSRLARAAGLDAERHRIVLAAGAGAGLAAVYNVPLGGALFTLEVLLRTRAPRACVAALATSGIATVTAWPFLGDHPTYAFPAWNPTLAAVLVATAVAPLVGLVAAPVGHGFRLLTTWARRHAPTGWRAVLGITVTFTALGAVAIPFPELLGNGRGLAQLDLGGPITIALAAELTLLKPLATAACLRSGAIGGLLTPAFATGATLGLLLAQLWANLWSPSAAVGFGLLAAAAVLAVTQRAPVTALVLAAEFAHPPLALLPALVVAVGVAAAAHRYAGPLQRRLFGRS